MKYFKLLLPAMFLAVLVSGNAQAEMDHHGKMDDDKHAGMSDMDKKGSHKKDWSDFKMMMTNRHKMMRDMMAMNRDVMKILVGLNHKPSADEKQQLSDMIMKLDKMIAMDKEMGMKMKDKWKMKGHHGDKKM